jgi:hypothetical protein
MGWFRDTFIGDPGRYNYADMCIPQVPWKKTEDKKAINFYAKGMSLNTPLHSIVTLSSLLFSHSSHTALILITPCYFVAAFR